MKRRQDELSEDRKENEIRRKRAEKEKEIRNKNLRKRSNTKKGIIIERINRNDKEL